MLQGLKSVLILSVLMVALVLAGSGLPLRAQEGDPRAEAPAGIVALYDALAMPEMIAIMRDEGLAYGEDIAADLFAGTPSPEALENWRSTVAAIYDAPRMEAAVMAALAAALDGQDVAPMIAFFTAAPGRDFIRLEVSARAALLDEAVEAMAKEAAAIAMADQTPRHDLIRRFVEANDLVETNVVGAMNSNFAFYLGMMNGGALPVELTEQELLADVWAREAEIRANTTEWVYAFLLMAYQPLPDADLEAYIAFSQTEAGRVLNRAMFAAFDAMFETISVALGQASAVYMAGQEL